jgi:hypothetical protein
VGGEREKSWVIEKNSVAKSHSDITVKIITESNRSKSAQTGFSGKPPYLPTVFPEGGTGPAGVNRDLSLLRQVLQQAKKQRYIAQNPLGDREHFLNERKERLQAKPFTVEEEQRLLAVATGYLRPLLILLDTGVRPSRTFVTTTRCSNLQPGPVVKR